MEREGFSEIIVKTPLPISGSEQTLPGGCPSFPLSLFSSRSAVDLEQQGAGVSTLAVKNPHIT